MLEMCERVPFAKQLVVECESGAIVGYTGVDHFEFEGKERLEWGYRLIPQSRGQGYATEASRALLQLAGETFSGDLLALIDPRNKPSQNVCQKLGFTFWKQAMVDDVLRNLYTLPVTYTGNRNPKPRERPWSPAPASDLPSRRRGAGSLHARSARRA